MLKVLPRQPVPQWLRDYQPGTSIDIRSVLDGSVYYPASGFDGDVLNLCMGFSHSFVYVDNCCLDRDRTKEVVLAEIDAPHNFRDFRKIFQREYDESELQGSFSYQPEPLRYGDGDPTCGLKPKAFFAILTVFEPKSQMPQIARSDKSTLIDVMERFAFLFICDDGNAAFQRYYTSHRVSPKAIAIIQPGDAFGGNWTSYYDERKVFSRAVHNNLAGVPELMLFGGYVDRRGSIFRKPFWSDYPYRNYYSRSGEKAISTWSRVRINETDRYIPLSQSHSAIEN